ncbi:MAG: hypothetical protein CSA55_03005 [Ilumatobacter coccineus]|uniref:Peptidase M16 family protein n=1 Tax=Ilumatobacter coccineus TaxID=467094 RepID=A0A2G6KAP3_9ACTN|nr:MAG: hypothetical protein CSA55_03005 [Ilumatobacter coccineus]
MARQHGLFGSRRPAVIALSLVGLIVSACSGAGDGESSPPATSAGSGSAATAETAIEVATTPPPSTVPPPPAPDLPGLPDFIDGPIHPDDAWQTGRFNNGLQYYVSDKYWTHSRTTLWLVVGAGSVDESDSTAGIAHLVQHLVFTGTENLSQAEIDSALSAFSLYVGPDVNGSAELTNTVYKLRVPTDDESIRSGLELLSEWLSGATFDPAQVEAERAVMLSEWSVETQNADHQLMRDRDNLLSAGTAYEGRYPFGNGTSIESITRTELVEFYETYYRPDNAALIIVGDVDDIPMWPWINDYFGSIEKPAEPKPARVDARVEVDTTPGALRVTDADYEIATVDVAFPLPINTGKHRANMMESIFDDLIFDIVADRLQRDIVSGDAPFFEVTTTDDEIGNRLGVRSISVSVVPDKADAALGAVLDEFERIARFGFDATEVEVVVKVNQASWEGEDASRRSKQDDEYAADAVANFLIGAPYPSVSIQSQMAVDSLSKVTADDLTERFWARWAHSAPHIVISGPESASDVLPTEDRALALVDGLRARGLVDREPLADLPDALMEPPEPIEASSTRVSRVPSNLHAHTVFSYPNGITLLVSNSKPVPGEAFIRGVSRGGSSLVADADLPNAHYVTDVVTSGGVASFTQHDVDCLLAGADMTVEARLEPYYEYLLADGTNIDIEVAFQLINLYLTEPRFDQVALDLVLQKDSPIVADPSTDINRSVADALADLRYGDDARYASILSPDEVARVDLDGIERVWRERFRPNDEWIFLLHGDIDMDAAKELGERYLGSLPTAQPDPPSPNVTAAFPNGIAVDTVHAGTGDTGSVVVRFTSPIDEVTAELRSVSDMAYSVVYARMRSVMDEDSGVVELPEVTMSFDTDPNLVITTTIELSVAADRVDAVGDAVVATLADLATNGPSEDEMKAAIAITDENYGWMTYGQVFDDMLDDWLHDTISLDDYLLAARPFSSWRVSAQDVQRFVADHLDTTNYVRVDQVPR